MKSTVSPFRGFSLLEVIMATAIFCCFCGVLYGLTDAVTRMARIDTLRQHRWNSMVTTLSRLELELSEALSGTRSLYIPGTEEREHQTMEFVCTTRNHTVSGIPMRLTPGTSTTGVQQMFLVKQEFRYTRHIDNPLIQWRHCYLSERVLYLDKLKRLRLFARTERLNATNYVTGEARTSDANRGRYFPPLSEPLVDLAYIFWGNSSRSWNDDGTGNIIMEWDSRIEVPGIHQQGELPRAIKVFLTYQHHPQMGTKPETMLDPSKYQTTTIERVIFLNHQVRHS